MKYLIWGGKGWIGSKLVKLLTDQGHEVILAKSSLHSFADINLEIKIVNPDFVLNTAGITGNPTVDWCEDQKQVTYLTNTIGIVNLVHVCWLYGIHITNYATGCIYTYNDKNPIGTSFTEEDKPNFTDSTYSHSKVLAEEMLSKYDNLLHLRLRMPVDSEPHSKNIINKLVKYAKVTNIPNSLTVLPEMLPISLQMTADKKKGFYNFTNPGAMTHVEILTLYKKYIDKDKTWEVFTVEEQDKILRSKRSNCKLNVDKLLKEYPVSDIHDSMEVTMLNLFKELKDHGQTKL